MPTQPRTDAQTNVRAILSGCSQNWQGLSPSEQNAWKAWADLHPRTDSLGQTVFMTGAQAFNAVNCLLLTVAGMGFVLPAVSVPPADPLPDPPNLGSMIILDDGSDSEIAFTPTPVPLLHYVLFYVSPPQSLGTTFCGDFRLMAVANPAATSVKEMQTQMNAKYGLPVIGQRYFCRARIMRADGGFSPWSNFVFGDVEAA